MAVISVWAAPKCPHHFVELHVGVYFRHELLLQNVEVADRSGIRSGGFHALFLGLFVLGKKIKVKHCRSSHPTRIDVRASPIKF